MRIITRYKDYYDGLQSYQDSLIYKRDTAIINQNIPTLDTLIKSFWPYKPDILGFCGRLYFIWTNSYYHSNNYKFMLGSYAYYKPDEVINQYKKERYYNERWASRVRNINNPIKEDHTIFQQYNMPLFYYTSIDRASHTILNPCLKDLEFYKVLDTYQTYQEIDMYVGGVLSNIEKVNPTTGGDLVILESKGFDKKLSFRTPSPGKKLNRRGK